MWPFDNKDRAPEPTQVEVTANFFEMGKGTKPFRYVLIANRSRGVMRTVAEACELYRQDYIDRHGYRFARELHTITVSTREV